MTTESYVICSPTIALSLEDGRHLAHLVPEGATISLDGKTFNGNKLIEVTWAGKDLWNCPTSLSGTLRQAPPRRIQGLPQSGRRCSDAW